MLIRSGHLFDLQFIHPGEAMRALGRPIVAIVAIGTLALSGVLFTASQTPASDHQDSPLTVSRPGIDITDVYVYPSPKNPKNVVLAMDVSPLIPAGMGTTRFFDPGAMYQLKIGHGKSYVESQVIQFKADGVGPTQRITMYGPGRPNMTGTRSTFIGSRMGSTTYNSVADLGNGVKFYAGPREDPFYFDLTQFFQILPDRNFKNQPNPPPPGATCFRKPGQDFLASFNVLQIAVELPRRLLAGPNGQLGRINVWATASIPSTDPNAKESGPGNSLAAVVSHMNSIMSGHGTVAQTYVQVERLGRPAVKEANIRIAPDRPLEQMAMAFNKPRQDHAVLEPRVELNRPKIGHLLRPAHRQDPPIPHRHMGGERLGRIHGDHPLRHKNPNRCAHDLSFIDARVKPHSDAGTKDREATAPR